jgi:hypothetical protein
MLLARVLRLLALLVDGRCHCVPWSSDRWGGAHGRLLYVVIGTIVPQWQISWTGLRRFYIVEYLAVHRRAVTHAPYTPDITQLIDI